jgi:hypothetical protein
MTAIVNPHRDAFVKALNLHFDHCDRMLHLHRDAHTAAIAGGLTRLTIAEVFKYKHASTPWANKELIQFEGGDSGATSVDWYSQGEGDTPQSAFQPEDGNIPFIDVFTEPHNQAIHTMLCGFKYSEQEVESYRMMGLSGGNIVSDKAAAAKSFFMRELDTAIRSGVTGKFFGMFSIPGSSQAIAGTLTGTTADWAGTATPEQIVNSFRVIRQLINTASNDTLIPDTVVFPSTVQGALLDQKSVASDVSVINWLKAAYPEITLWKTDPRQNTAGYNGTAAMIMYNRQRDHLRASMPLMLKPLPLLVQHQKMEQGFRSRFGGLIVPYPKAVAVLSNI